MLVPVRRAGAAQAAVPPDGASLYERFCGVVVGDVDHSRIA
jgi:hypothetical protein